MIVQKLDKSDLVTLGFEYLSAWNHNGSLLTHQSDMIDLRLKSSLDAPSALYAFVQDDTVKYIGKTARSIRKRFIGYCNPGKTQATNRRCFDHIKASLSEGRTTEILVFTPISDLQKGIFQIDLAAGLEESLIREFNPPWNGGGRHKITEEAELEAEIALPEEAQDNELLQTPIEPLEKLASLPSEVTFQIRLGKTYYEQGFINCGLSASPMLGKEGDLITIELAQHDKRLGSEVLVSKINRTANANGTVRIVGRNRQIARWFQENFERDDTVIGTVVDEHHIILNPNKVLMTST